MVANREDTSTLVEGDELSALRRRLEEAERARDEAMAMFRAVFDSSLVMVSVTDARTGAYRSVNAAFERTTGFPAKEAVGKDSVALGLMPPPRVLARLRAELAELGRTQPLAMVVVDPATKEERDVLFAATLVHGESGPVVITVAHDPTRMAREIAEVRNGTDRLRVILDSVPDAVYFVDPLGHVVECNRAALRAWDTAAKSSSVFRYPRCRDVPTSTSRRPSAVWPRGRRTPGRRRTVARTARWSPWICR